MNFLQYIELPDLLCNVTRSCKRLNSIIHSSSVLWRNISFDFQINLSYDSLKRLLEHASGFRTFQIPFIHLECLSSDVDWLFMNGQRKAKELYWLDLTDCKLSTCFQCLPNIQILNLSGCHNLADDDFLVIQKCLKLEQLYVSFTNIKPTTIMFLSSKLKLSVLEACAVPLGINDIESVFSYCYRTLLYVHLTLSSE